jgi:hypothetical protein
MELASTRVAKIPANMAFNSSKQALLGKVSAAARRWAAFGTSWMAAENPHPAAQREDSAGFCPHSPDEAGFLSALAAILG